MFNNKKSVVILLLVLHSTLSLKQTDLCVLKQQVCKAHYDEQQYYQTKCNLIKCHGTFNFKCNSNICTRNKVKCTEYNHMMLSMKSSFHITSIFAPKINHWNSFNKNIKECQIQAYKFDSSDFCINGKQCIVINLGKNMFDTNQMTVECRCSTPKQNFKCGKYCASDSIACHYFKQPAKLNSAISRIKDCGNHNSTYFRYFFKNF